MLSAIQEVNDAMGHGRQGEGRGNVQPYPAVSQSLQLRPDLDPDHVITEADLVIAGSEGAVPSYHYWDWLGQPVSAFPEISEPTPIPTEG